MSDAPKIHEFDSLEKRVDRPRDDFVIDHHDVMLIDACSGIDLPSFSVPSPLVHGGR